MVLNKSNTLYVYKRVLIQFLFLAYNFEEINTLNKFQ